MGVASEVGDAAGVFLAAGLSPIIRLILAISALVLLEMLFSATTGDLRWTFKHLVIALATIFGSDLYFASEAFLFRSDSGLLSPARHLVHIVAVPFLMVGVARVRGLALDVNISRRVVMGGTMLVGSGGYLLLLAAAAVVLQRTNLPPEYALHVPLFAAGLMILAILLLSGRIRAHVKAFVATNFFSLYYDYREEWLRFIATMTESNTGLSMHERALQAIRNILDCTSAALFIEDHNGRFHLVARSNWPNLERLSVIPPSVVDLLRNDVGPINLIQAPDVLMQLEDLFTSDATAAATRPWLLVPLAYRNRLIGIAALANPLAQRPLTAEDQDMLRIVGIQIASYVAEEEMTRALVEARRFENISKKFTFVAHDIKNLVSQLSITVQQAERHGDNPAFQRDAMATMRDSVEKMQNMLTRLKDTAERDQDEGAIFDLSQLITEAVDTLNNTHPAVDFHAYPSELPVLVAKSSLVRTLQNVAQNAIEASGGQCKLDIMVDRDGDAGIVEITDDGPGMSPDYVSQHLFRPFSSSKTTGFGIGLYQCREEIEHWGGRLEIESQSGVGTTVRISLPLARSPETIAAGHVNAKQL